MNMNKNKKLYPMFHHYCNKDDWILIRNRFVVDWSCKSCYDNNKC